MDIAGDDKAAPITVAGIKAEVSLNVLAFEGGISFARHRGRPFLGTNGSPVRLLLCRPSEFPTTPTTLFSA